MEASDVIAVVARYLEALERFDLEAVADCFTDDLFYSHPAYAHDRDGGPPRHEVRGRQSLIALLEQRGRVQVDHEVHSAALQGADGFVAGTFASGSRRGSFVSTIRLAPDGRIARYAAYASVPPVGESVGPESAPAVG